MKKFSFISLVFLLVLQSFIGPIAASANAETVQSFTANIAIDDTGKASMVWSFIAGNEVEDKEYTFQSGYQLDAEQSGELLIDRNQIGTFTISVEGLITATILAGQTQNGIGSVEVNGVKIAKEVEEVTEENTGLTIETPDAPIEEVEGGNETIEGDNKPLTSGFDEIVPSEHVEKISVLVNNPDGSKQDITEITNYEPQNGDSVTVAFDIKVDAGHNFGEGSKLTYTLPEIFSNVTGTGDVGTVGKFQIEGGKVVVTFNNTIRDDANQGVEIHDASFSVGAKYSETNTSLEYELLLPGQDKITLNFKPKVGSAIIKAGEPENNGVSSNFIKWTVDVNTKLDTLTNAQFKDVLTQGNPGKHKYIDGSLEVIELIVNAKGDIEVGGGVSITPPSYADATELVFSLPDGKKAYRVSYKTKIDESDSDKGKAQYTNTASITNNGSTQNTSGTANVTWGPPLEKSVVKSNDYGKGANWTVKYNYNRKTIAQSDAVLTDKITGNHKINAATDVKIYDESGKNEIDSNLYTVALDSDGKGYVLTFNQEVKEPYQIKYTTVPTDYFTVGGTVSNIITRKDGYNGTPGSNDASFKYSNPGIVKKATGTNYQDKTMDWEIVVNQDGYPMEDIVITDIFAGQGMKYKEGSLKVVGLNEGDFVFTDKGTEGFTFTVTGPINSRFTIKYTTNYEIKDTGTNDRTYKNTAKLKWESNNKEYNSEGSDEAIIDNKQKANGYKRGVYNYETKEFKWTVGINFNLNTLTDAVFKDTLPEGQKVKVETIVVQPVDVKPDGTTTPNGTPMNVIPTFNGENAFEIGLGKITGAYEITYTSVDADGKFPVTPNDPNAKNLKVKNEAELLDGTTSNAKWNDEITVAHTNETLTKNGEGFNDTSRIDWNLRLNYGQSNLANVKIEDAVGKDVDGNPNQLILEDTFKVYEVALTGESKKGTPTETKTLVTEGYTVVVDNKTGTFTLAFNDSITKAYYIEYQSIFLGAPNDEVKNEATLSYDGISTGIKEEKERKFNYWFSGSGSTKKVPYQIIKTDAESGDLLPGAKFALYNMDNIKLTEGVTDAKGELLFPSKLGEGQYWLVEVEAPKGYVKKEREKITLSVKFLNQDNVQIKPVTNKKIKQEIELKKTDAHDNSTLDGVEFELRLKDQTGNYNIVAGKEKLTTENGGIIKVVDLEPGEYQLIETKSLPGYWLDKTPIEFKVLKNQTEITKKVMKNSKQGELIVKKVDADDSTKFLPGASFELSNGTEVYKATTDIDGIAKFINVKYGTYTLKETAAPVGYLLDAGSTIVKDGISVDIKTPTTETEPINNKKILNAVKLIKTDADSGAFLKGAEFKLLYTDRDEIVKDRDGNELKGLKTNEAGEIQIGDLAAGEYRLIETKAPQFYLLDETEHHFKIVDNQTAFTPVSVTNKRGQGEIVITKVDAADKSILIDGVEFELSNEDGSIKKTGTTVNGIVTFIGLPYGNYNLKETKAHKDYLLDPTVHTIVLDSATQVNGAVVPKIIENSRTNRSVTLTKYNSDKTIKLPGAIFELRKATANVDIEGKHVYEVVPGIDVTKLTTGNNGEISLKDLPIGKYQLIETKAPSGYKLDKTPVEFEIIEKQDKTLLVDKTNIKISTGGGGDNPGEPGNPGNPGEPGNPGNPGEPSNPGNPGEPGNPGNPGEPGNPGNPGEPGNPGNPGEPDTPGEPGNPGEPSNPGEPGNTGNADNMGQTGKPNNSGNLTGSAGANGSNFLPQTGDTYPVGTLAAGIVSILVGLWIMISRRRVSKA